MGKAWIQKIEDGCVIIKPRMAGGMDNDEIRTEQPKRENLLNRKQSEVAKEELGNIPDGEKTVTEMQTPVDVDQIADNKSEAIKLVDTLTKHKHQYNDIDDKETPGTIFTNANSSYDWRKLGGDPSLRNKPVIPGDVLIQKQLTQRLFQPPVFRNRLINELYDVQFVDNKPRCSWTFQVKMPGESYTNILYQSQTVTFTKAKTRYL